MKNHYGLEYPYYMWEAQQECKDGLFHVECGHVKTTTNHIQDVSICLLDTSYTLRLIVKCWENVKKCVSSHRKLIEVRG